MGQREPNSSDHVVRNLVIQVLSEQEKGGRKGTAESPTGSLWSEADWTKSFGQLANYSSIPLAIFASTDSMSRGGFRLEGSPRTTVRNVTSPRAQGAAEGQRPSNRESDRDRFEERISEQELE